MLPLVHTSNLWRQTEIEKLLKGNDSDTRKLLQTIKPIMHVEGREMWSIVPPDSLSGTAYLWDPERDMLVEKHQIKELAIVTTYHSCGYALLPKPDLVETMAQIPKELLDRVAYFELLMGDAEIVQSPLTQLEWFDMGKPSVFYGHKILMRLYETVHDAV